MLNIKMSKEDLANLKTFLGRTSLTGHETMAFVKIMQVLDSATEEVYEDTQVEDN